MHTFSRAATAPVNHYEIISVHKVESIWEFKWSTTMDGPSGSGSRKDGPSNFIVSKQMASVAGWLFR